MYKNPLAWVAMVGVVTAGCVESAGVGSDPEEIINGDWHDPSNSGMAFLFLPSPTGPWECSGTLIVNDWVLTAKHCFIHDLPTIDPRRNPASLFVSMAGQTSAAAEIIFNPDYDVALVRLVSPMTMNGSTTGFEQRLYPHPHDTLNGQTVSCFGYGANTIDGSSTELHTADLAVSTYLLYDKTYVNRNSRGQTLYYGDSGGGCFSTLWTGEKALIGVTSDMAENQSDAGLVSADEIRVWVGETRATYQIVAKNSGRCADVLNYSTDNNGAIVQYDCYGSVNQSYRIIPLPGGRVLFRAMNSGKCLEPQGWTGAPLVQYDCDEGIGQQWNINHRGDGWVSIENADTGECLDVPGASAANFWAWQQYPCNGGDNQRFRLDMKPNAPTYSVAQGNICLDVAGFATGDHGVVQIYDCHGGGNQKWSFPAVATAIEQARPAHAPGECLDIPFASTSPGVALQQFGCVGGAANQQWRISRTDAYGWSLLRSPLSNLCASVDSPSHQVACGGGNTLWTLF